MPILSLAGLCAPDAHPITPLEQITPETTAIFFDNHHHADQLSTAIEHLKLIVIPFPNISDGRGFSIAKALRHKGYSGLLRASGEITPDQFTHALLSGFDQVEISAARLERQPLEQWRPHPQFHLWRERLQSDAS